MTTSRGALRGTAAIVMAAGVLSCGDTSAPSINPVDFLLAEVDGSWSNSAASYMALAYTPSAPARVPAASCDFSQSKQAFVCPQRTWTNLTFDLSYQLLDAGNTPLTSYDKQTVAAVRTMTAVAGAYSLDATTTRSVASSGDRILSGLLGGDPTVNGTDNGTYIYNSASFHDTSYTVATITNFKVPPRNSPTFPTGVITTVYYSVPPDVGVAPDGTSTMTFDGSQFAKFAYSFGGFSVMCTFDLKGISETVCTP